MNKEQEKDQSFLEDKISMDNPTSDIQSFPGHTSPPPPPEKTTNKENSNQNDK